MKLNAATRKNLSGSAFALPGRRYPIMDKSHGIAAEAYAKRYATPEEQATIRRKVHAKFPTLGKSKDKK